MRIAVFSTKPYDRKFLDAANDGAGHELHYFEARLNGETGGLAAGFPAVCVFVNDLLDATTLGDLERGGTRLIALRCAGVNHVDLTKAGALGLTVVRVPAYSPNAVAEHTVGLILTLNRQLHRAYNRVREGNFSLDGLLGFDLKGRTVGIVGTGKIGVQVARIMAGFGCQLLAHDRVENPDCLTLGARYVTVRELLAGSDIVTLHCPLTPETHHLFGREAVELVRPGVMLINTSRGAVVDTNAVIRGLKSGKIGYVGLDVYEEEADLFFEDQSNQVLLDDRLARLLTFPNVVITGHQAFFTREALQQIARTMIQTFSSFERGEPVVNEASAHQSG